MDIKWHNTNSESFEQLILAGDIGGTNSTYAILGKKDQQFSLLVSCRFGSQDVTGVIAPLKQTLKAAADKLDISKIARMCLSAAGPSNGRKCQPTNIEWAIDADEIERETQIKTVLINDFAAISYSLPLLDLNDPEQILKVAHPQDRYPESTGNVRAVVGAGTGLGVGYGLQAPSGYIAGASEGGHCTFHPFDSASSKLHDYLYEKFGSSPDAESYVSGQGINNIFDYYCEINKSILSTITQDILNLDHDDRPAAISCNIDNDKLCYEVMKLFVSMYGKFCGEMAAVLLPTAGMYLGGGIVTKNEKLFTEYDWFIQAFESNFCENIQRSLKDIPVYIIRNYSVSLFGAAHAATILA